MLSVGLSHVMSFSFRQNPGKPTTGRVSYCLQEHGHEPLAHFFHPSTVNNFILAGLRNQQKHRHDDRVTFSPLEANCTIFRLGYPNLIHASDCITLVLYRTPTGTPCSPGLFRESAPPTKH